MEDHAIIDLLWQREEAGIVALQERYGGFCSKLACGILPPLDAEECLNSTWLAAWNAIPPQRPGNLRAWLGRVVRNLCLNRWESMKAQKRDCGMAVLLGELEETLPGGQTPQQMLEARELSTVIARWLQAQPAEERKLFLRRYWYGLPVKTLAQERGQTPRAVASRLYRLRQSLKTTLEQEGIVL